jgi:hypothetical protein
MMLPALMRAISNEAEARFAGFGQGLEKATHLPLGVEAEAKVKALEPVTAPLPAHAGRPSIAFQARAQGFVNSFDARLEARPKPRRAQRENYFAAYAAKPAEPENSRISLEIPRRKAMPPNLPIAFWACARPFPLEILPLAE